MSNITGQEDSVITQDGGAGERVLMDPRLYEAASKGKMALLDDLLNRNIEENVQQGHTVINVAPQAPQEHNNVSFLSGVTPTRDTALHIAAYFGHLEVAKKMCYENRHLLLHSNDKAETPLHYAAQAGNHKLVTFFIQFAGEEGDFITELLRKRNQDGETALYQAIQHCQVLGIEKPRGFVQVLCSYFNLRKENIEAIQELYEAEKNNHAAVAEDLVHADLASAIIPSNQSMPQLACITDNNDVSPLYLAIVQYSLSIVTSLVGSLPENASREAYAGPDGRTALHAAVVRSKGFTEKILGWKPELTKSTDNYGSTPLHYAASYHANVGIVKMLLEIDSTSAHIADSAGLYPIHVAAKLGDVQSVSLIFHHCPYSSELRDREGRNFLHVAVKENNGSVVSWACKNSERVLVKAINSQDNNGDTPMHLAVQARDLEIFSCLLGSLKINVCIMNKHGMTPHDIAFVAKEEIGFGHPQNPIYIMSRALDRIQCTHGIHRFDMFLSEHDLMIDRNKEEKLAENFENMAKSMAIGSTLIASAAFAGTYTISVAYKTDVQLGQITPGLSVAFKAFILMAAYAFVCSIVVTVLILEAALAFLDSNYRGAYIVFCSDLVLEAAKGFVVAFALGVLVIMIQVSQWRLACLVCFGCSVVPVLIQPHFWPNILVQRALVKCLGIKSFTLIGGRIFLRNIAYGIIVLLALLGGKWSTTYLAEQIVLTIITAILLLISYPFIFPLLGKTWIRTSIVRVMIDNRLFLVPILSIAYLLLFFPFDHHRKQQN